MESERTEDAGQFPKVLLLDTTNYCNLKCSMCSHKIMQRPQGKMSMPLFRKIIDEIAEKDKTARVWMVFFGEALILKHQLAWQIFYAKRKGLTDVVLNSNGTLLTEENARCLIESGLDAIYIGIDAFDPITYSQNRVGGNYEKTVSNVNRLIELKKEYKSETPKVFVQYVVMDNNQDGVKGFTDYWTERGAEVKIRPKVTWAGTVSQFNVKSMGRYPCYWAMRTFNICWDGRVSLCSCDFDCKFNAGDVNNESIQSIWLNSLKKIRDLHVGGRFNELPDFCYQCTDWQMARAEYYG